MRRWVIHPPIPSGRDRVWEKAELGKVVGGLRAARPHARSPQFIIVWRWFLLRAVDMGLNNSFSFVSLSSFAYSPA